MNPSLRTFLLTAFALLTLGSGSLSAQATDEQLAIQYYQNREYDKALALFENMFGKNPNLFNYTYYLNILIETQDFEKAEKVLKKQVRSNPNDLRYRVDYGYVLIMKGDNARGKKEYDDCLKNLPADRNQVISLASAYLVRREMEYTIKTYQRGRDLLNDQGLFAFELANLYEQLGNWDSMMKEYFSMLRRDPSQLPSVEYRIQNWLGDDPENTKNDLFRNELLKQTQSNPDEISYAELLLWYSTQQKDFTLAMMQAKALDRRYNEPGNRVYDLAMLSKSNDDFEVAIDGFSYVIQKNASGSLVLMSRIELLNTELMAATGSLTNDPLKLANIEKGYLALLDETGIYISTVPLIRNLAHLQAFYLQKSDSAISLLERAVRIPGLNPRTQAECKLELADIYLFSGEQWEATLLYSQVEKAFKNEPAGHEAKFRNAKLSYYIGEFGWAKAQLDILKAATSKLIANDALELSLLIGDNIEEDSVTAPLAMFARADLDYYRNDYAAVLAVLDSIIALFPGHPIIDNILFKKAQIAEKRSDFGKAGEYYAEIVKDYPADLLADESIFALARLNEEKFGNKDKARELYQLIITNYPGSLLVVDARKHFRALRNDPVN